MPDLDLSLPPARSFLYAPADRPDRYSKAVGRAGDAVIFDLEDAVAPAAKDEARLTLFAWLRQLERPRAQIWVRVNSGERLAADIAAVVSTAVTGIVVPKATSADLAIADAAVSAAEQAQSLAPRRIWLSPLIESAAGLIDLPAVAAAPRVSHLALGEADLAADLGLVDPDDTVWQPLRLQVVVASAAAGISPPNGPVDTSVRDLSTLAATSTALRRIGFGGRSALHPDQVPVIEAAFAPTAREVEHAAATIAAYDAAASGGATDHAGRYVDEAVVRSARRIIALAAREA